MSEPVKKINLRDAIGIKTDARPQTKSDRQATATDGDARNVWKIQAEFLNRLDTQRSAINKAIEANEPLEDVLLKALECIAIMSGDKLFYTSNKEKIKRRQ